MEKSKVTIRLKQASINKHGIQEYVVKSVSNATKPRIHTRFSEKEVNNLIKEGYKISITGT